MAASLRYQAVLFDLDGTLVDSYAALAEAVNHARRLHALVELETDRIRDLVGDGVERLLQRAFGRTDVPETVLEAFQTRYDEVCCAESRVLAGVRETLEELSTLGVAMAVCTNKPTGFSRKILDHLGLSRHFKSIVGPDAAGARKPEARHVLFTLQSVQCTAEQALFVGDMPVDVRAARAGGLDVAVVPSGSASLEQLLEAEPDHLLERFSDLTSIVRREAA